MGWLERDDWWGWWGRWIVGVVDWEVVLIG